MSDTARILVTGSAWLNQGLRTIDSVIREALSTATRDVILTIYLTTPSLDLTEMVKSALDRGVRVHLLFNDWAAQPAAVQQSLRAIVAEAAGLSLYDCRDPSGRGALHAKAVAVDGCRAIVGSANLSAGGFIWNHELAVLLEGPAAEAVSRLLYRLAATLGKPIF